MIHGETNRRIIILVRGLLILTNRIGIIQRRRTGTLRFHISPAHEFHAGDIISRHGVIVDTTQIRHPVMTIHLQGGEYDRTFLVELTHRLIGKRIDGILETIILRIH